MKPTDAFVCYLVEKLMIGASAYRLMVQPRRLGIGIQQPDLALGEIGHQLRVVLGRQNAGPDDFRAINVGRVVDPFVQRVVVGRIIHEYEVFAWR